MTEQRKGPERHVAKAMVDVINGDDAISQLVRAENVADPKKRLEQLNLGEFIVDIIGRGSRRARLNRGFSDPVIVVAVAIHSRLQNAQVSTAVLDEASWLCDQVTEFIHTIDELILPDPWEPAILLESEPFPLSREALFGHGLFLQTMQFSWQTIQ